MWEMTSPRLRDVLNDLGSVLVAYSGGVDSAYLAWAANDVLGPRSLAAIADSPSLPRAELDDALRLAGEAGFAVEVVRTKEFANEEYLRNEPDRCFHCKQALFDEVFPLAASRGLAHVALGTVTDDLGDVRPGLVSAKRRGAKQPLLDAGLSKADVRRLANEAGLRVWDKPQAACLSSRIPHGTRVTTDALGAIERAEEAVRSLGFDVVRVRHYSDVARVEVDPSRVDDALAMSDEIIAAVRASGYADVTIDPRGYRRGGARLPVLDN
jgi:pyridinium-3,5-biscarboxylic acid mononucleotide sulfurtransferase